MNVMNALVSAVSSAPSGKVGKSEGNSTSFQSLLTGQEKTESDASSNENEASIASLIESLGDTNLQDLLNQLLNGELTSLEDLEMSEGQLLQLQNLLAQIDGMDIPNLSAFKNQIGRLIHAYNDNISDENVTDSEVKVEERIEIAIPPSESIQNEIIQLIGEINRILSSSDDVSLKDKASELLPLLRQWSALKGQTDDSEVNRLIDDELSEKNAGIWKQLVNVFEKRSYFTESNMYRSDSAITRNDVMNWLEQAFNRYESSTQAERTVAPVIVANQPVLMTEIQQHTIHVNSLDRVDRVSEEVLSKFNTIVRESRFMTNNNLNQLSITLRPDNLGQMIVRFTQIDGEMAVKIIVSSQAAKSMLESNVHQLKHMFSPHQVVIERDEAISDEEFFGKEEELEEHDEETLKDGESSQENKDNDAPEIDFNELFQQLSEEELTDD